MHGERHGSRIAIQAYATVSCFVVPFEIPMDAQFYLLVTLVFLVNRR